jgi:tetratricopeptide (TPR) repeat protein
MPTHHSFCGPLTPANLKRAKADIKQYSINHEPTRWADGHILVAQQYLAEVVGSSGPTRAAEKGIEHIEEALKVITEETRPPSFAVAQCGLARMYCKRVSGNRTNNLTKALACAKAALRVSKNSCSPLVFAAEVYATIGSIYADLDFESSNSPASNEDLAIRHYLASLQRSSMQDDNDNWVTTQLNVGMIYFRRQNGNERSNMKVAIKHFVEALKVLTKSKHRKDWARTHQCLALSYWQLISSADLDISLTKMSKEEFIEAMSPLVEKCIASCKDALQVFSTTNEGPDW